MYKTTLETVFSAHKAREQKARQELIWDMTNFLRLITNMPPAEQPTQANIHATLPLPEVTNTIRLSTMDHL